jgi:hypothetical protein
VEAAELPVAPQGDRATLAVLEQLGERVLEQRQRSGLAEGVGQELGEQRRLDLHADPAGRLGHGLLEGRDVQREDVDDVRREQLGERRDGAAAGRRSRPGG